MVVRFIPRVGVIAETFVTHGLHLRCFDETEPASVARSLMNADGALVVVFGGVTNVVFASAQCLNAVFAAQITQHDADFRASELLLADSSANVFYHLLRRCFRICAFLTHLSLQAYDEREPSFIHPANSVSESLKPDSRLKPASPTVPSPSAKE